MKRAEQPKVAVFACGLEASSTETKGTVLIRTGEELMSYNKVGAPELLTVTLSFCCYFFFFPDFAVRNPGSRCGLAWLGIAQP